MTCKNTNIIPIKNPRSAKRFLTRYFADKRSKTEAEDDGPSQSTALYPDAGKWQDMPKVPGKDASLNVPDVKPRSFVDPGPNVGRYPDFSTAIVYAVTPVFPEDTNMMVELIRISLSESSQLSATLFTNCTVPMSREQFLRPRSIVDDGQGAVYAFFNEQKAVYVGKTGSKVKSLLKAPTSPVVDAAWWPPGRIYASCR